MNVKKTKTMVVTKHDENIQANIKIENETLEQVNSFNYLGQMITPDGRNEDEIKIKIAIAKNRFHKCTKILHRSKYL